MKRGIAALVGYSSSEEDIPDPEPVVKKRKLPGLPSSLLGSIPKDDPALHQGRIRTTPHVDGQFAAHVYVALILKRSSPLHTLVGNVLRDTKELVPTIHEIVPPDAESIELHVSLSRPVFLRAHQREDLKRSVRNAARAHAPFAFSFAAFSELVNDEKTRTFLTLEVGAGHHELHTLCDSLTPVLQSFRQKEYYDTPRFHASIAWALLDRSCSRKQDFNADLESRTSDFPTIPGLPESLIPLLEDKYHTPLSTPQIGTFQVDKVFVKIGKDVSSWKLNGHE